MYTHSESRFHSHLQHYTTSRPFFHVSEKADIPPYTCFLHDKVFTISNTIKAALDHINRFIITDLLPPCSRVLLGKLTGSLLVKKFPAFYGTRKFITIFTIAHHLSLSLDSSIHSIHLHPTSWRSILLLSFHLVLGLPSGLFPSNFPTKPCTRLSSPPQALHDSPVSFFLILSPPKENNQVQSTTVLLKM